MQRSLVVLACGVALAACVSGGDSSATTAESQATTTSAPISLPSACDTYPPDVRVPVDSGNFPGLVSLSDSLEGFTVESVSWQKDLSGLWAYEVGSVIFTGRDDDGRSLRLQLPTACAFAAELAGAMPVGSKLTVLLQNASSIQVDAGFADPKIVTAWYGDDWSQTAYAPVGGLAEFEQLASAQGKAPFDLLAEMLVG